MEYFGGLSDLISPRDIVVGTAPDSLLTLVSQDLPEDIFDHDEDEETDEDGGGSDLHAADAIDAVMDSNNADINLASVIDDLDASFGAPDCSLVPPQECLKSARNLIRIMQKQKFKY